MNAQSGQHAALIVSPPYVIAPDLGIRAIDVSLRPGPQRGERHQPLICLGGHPAKECVIDVEGSGQSHDPVLEVDLSLSSHTRFVDRVREVLDPRIRLAVTPRETANNSQIVPREGME